tara:strand:- start:494 stop:997 length:504 start_codon:yes stop_codon:yes gene_type:complete
MQKKVLSEVALYTGDVDMPKDFKIDLNALEINSVEANVNRKKFIYSKEWDKLNQFIIDHLNIKYDLSLINKNNWGNIYSSGETSIPLLNINPVDLHNSPDFTLLYGVKTNNCKIKIFYDDNRRKGRSWDIDLTDNKFIMFPATCMYYITNKQNNYFNFVETITYEFI